MLEGCDTATRHRVSSTECWSYVRVSSVERCRGDKLVQILNDEARQGWDLKSISHADVKGRIGPGAVERMLLTLERPLV